MEIVTLFLLACVITAGCYGALSAILKIVITQAIPANLALTFERLVRCT